MSVADSPLYFDTSVLLPLYRQEAITPRVEHLQAERTAVVSTLVEVEFASAVSRWVRMGELTETQAQSLEETFAADLRGGEFERVEMEGRHYWQARYWLLQRNTGLRTLDALHLACATGNDAILVTADRILAEAVPRHHGRVQFIEAG